MQRPVLQQPAALTRRYVAHSGRLLRPPGRRVLCKDAVTWLEEQPSLPSVVTSLPDITELAGSAASGRGDDAAYGEWFSATVRLVVSKLRRGSVALFYQTDTLAHSSYVDKSYLCTAGAVAGGGTVLFHKIALRHAVNAARSGKMPTFTHVMAYAGPGTLLDPARIHSTCSAAIPDVAYRGDVAWVRGMGVQTALGACRFVRDVVARPALRPPPALSRPVLLPSAEQLRPFPFRTVAAPAHPAQGDAEVCDPFCGSGTVLAAANSLGLDAVGVELSSKRARHAAVMEIVEMEGGELVARRSTDRDPAAAAGRASGAGRGASPSGAEAAEAAARPEVHEAEHEPSP